MPALEWLPWALAVGAVVAVALTYPYVATAISYRRSDNGLAYILFAIGVGFWNAMVAAQLLDPRPLVKGFFFSLSVVGASLAGLGWFLFAGTASSTPAIPRSRPVYGVVAVLVGINIAGVVTSPAHALYWLVADGGGAGFAAVDPTVGYWLYTQLLVVLFGAGTVAFAVAWEDGRSVRYTRAYTVAGTATVAAVVGSNVVAPGGFSVAPLAAASLAAIGWVQADDGRTIAKLRPYLPFARSAG